MQEGFFVDICVFLKARVGNIEETSKSKLHFEIICPALQSHSTKTHKRALPDYGWSVAHCGNQ